MKQQQQPLKSTGLGHAFAVAVASGTAIPVGKNTTIPEYPELELPIDHRKMIVVKLNFVDNQGRAPQWVPQDLLWEGNRDLKLEDDIVKAQLPDGKEWKGEEGRLRAGRVDTADRKMTKAPGFVTLSGLWNNLGDAGYRLFGAKAYWKKLTQRDREEIADARRRKIQMPPQKGCIEITFVHDSKRSEFWAASTAAKVVGIGPKHDSRLAHDLFDCMERAFGFVPCFSNSVPSETITINPQKPPNRGSLKRVALTLRVREDDKLALRFDPIQGGD